MFGELSNNQLQKLQPYVSNKIVYDLGAGTGEHSTILAKLGAKQVVAVDKESIRISHSSKILKIEKSFIEIEVKDIDIAFLSWPVNYHCNGLISLLKRSNRIVYLGRNTNGTTCGTVDLFEYFLHRKLIDYISEYRNTLIIYGEEILKRISNLQEEIAIFSSEIQWYSELKNRLP